MIGRVIARARLAVGLMRGLLVIVQRYCAYRQTITTGRKSPHAAGARDVPAPAYTRRAANGRGKAMPGFDRRQFLAAGVAGLAATVAGRGHASTLVAAMPAGYELETQPGHAYTRRGDQDRLRLDP